MSGSLDFTRDRDPIHVLIKAKDGEEDHELEVREHLAIHLFTYCE